MFFLMLFDYFLSKKHIISAFAYKVLSIFLEGKVIIFQECYLKCNKNFVKTVDKVTKKGYIKNVDYSRNKTQKSILKTK